MIYFVSTAEHTYTHKPAQEAKDAPEIRMLSYEQAFAARQVPPGSYVFTDMDRLSLSNQFRAADIYRQLAARPNMCRVFNDPARAKGRYALLRALHEAGLNSFNVYRAEECVRPERFPVFIRYDSEHVDPLSGLLHDQASLDAAIEKAIADGAPEGSILIVEYCAEPVVEGLFRKLAAYRVGDTIVPAEIVHDDQWCVKYGQKGIATPELYEEERQIVETNPYNDIIARAFEIGRIEYGRADFGIVDGKVQIYEINTNPRLGSPSEHPSEVRVQSQARIWANYLAALHTIDFP